MRKINWSDEVKFVLHGSINRHSSIYHNTESSMCCWITTEAIWCYGDLFRPKVSLANFLMESIIMKCCPNMVCQNYNSDMTMIPWSICKAGSIQLCQLCETFIGFTTYGSNTIDRRSTIELAQRSPNLKPMDFFFGGTMKDSVYGSKSRSLDNIKTVITTKFNIVNSSKELWPQVPQSVI